MLSPRVLTALLAIPVVALVVWQGGVLFFAVAFLLAFLSLYEIAGASRTSGTPLVEVLAYPALFLVMLTPLFLGSGHSALAHTESLLPWLPWMIVVLVSVWAVVAYPTPRRVSLVSVALTFLSIFYVGLFTFLVLLRELHQGYIFIWLTLLGVWTGDTVAYYAGRAWGRTKLTSLSPGKTREGALAGLLGTVMVCTFVAWRTNLGLPHGIILGVLIGLIAPLGDLAESFWKRELGVKDLGSLLPGHGGVLDRCDSLLFAAFTVYCYVLSQM
ncbi:MAG: phosphatidate cytidylyltransferase [Abitibacteriaceae bacterium]|nr:phosphatidate cytidylyltransferase [Abditibacteriaceae bacterium]